MSARRHVKSLHELTSHHIYMRAAQRGEFPTPQLSALLWTLALIETLKEQLSEREWISLLEAADEREVRVDLDKYLPAAALARIDNERLRRAS